MIKAINFERIHTVAMEQKTSFSASRTNKCCYRPKLLGALMRNKMAMFLPTIFSNASTLINKWHNNSNFPKIFPWQYGRWYISTGSNNDCCLKDPTILSQVMPIHTLGQCWQKVYKDIHAFLGHNELYILHKILLWLKFMHLKYCIFCSYLF